MRGVNEKTECRSSIKFDQSTPGERIAAFIDQIKSGSEQQANTLVPFLSERHPIYRDRSTNEIVRIRGYAMAALERTGLSDRALPYVLEDLESTFHPYMVAAAARALRGMKRPHSQVTPYLIKAIYNIWQGDKPISFSRYHVEWPLKNYTTALTEVFNTLTHLGTHAQKVLPDLKHLVQFFSANLGEDMLVRLNETIEAIERDGRELPSDCCKLPLLANEDSEHCGDRASKRIHQVVIEDQNSSRLNWGEFFGQKPAVLGFFYTRCENPRKCTQTIFNLAALQVELEQCGLKGKVRVAAVTYDPQFDTPEALKSYGNARGFLFDNDYRMFRVPEEFVQVIEAFKLGVNHTGSQVNSHRIELFLLDRDGNVVQSFVRTQSEPRLLLEALTAILKSESRTLSRALQIRAKRLCGGQQYDCEN